MGKQKLSEDKILQIRSLRSSGFSIKEIVSSLKLGTGTVSKYCKGIALDEKAIKILQLKMYSARRISEQEKVKAKDETRHIIGDLNKRDMFLIFSALYWGEGAKRELSIINGDSELILVFLRGLLSLGVKREKIKISIRYYQGQSKEKLAQFWTKKLALPVENIVGFEMVTGNGSLHKLEQGMCRLRMEKSSYCHRLMMSAIDIITSGSSIG